MTTVERSGSGDRLTDDASKVLHLAAARQAVDDLLHFRNTYLGQTAQHLCLFDDELVGSRLWTSRSALQRLLATIQTESRAKGQSVWKKFTATMNLLRELEPGLASGSPREKAEFCYLNGKAMNAVLSSEDEDTREEGDTTDDDNATLNKPPTLPDAASQQSGNFEVSRGNLVATAVRWLTRALKFNPELTSAWCELGESYWRQGDLVTAKQHFSQALKVDANSTEALCQLSMLLRHMPSANSSTSLGHSSCSTTITTAAAAVASTTSNPTAAVEVHHRQSPAVEESIGECSSTSASSTTSGHLGESLRLAHAAVQLSPLDGHAWLILGNALLTAFFADPLAPFGLPTLAQIDSGEATGSDSKPSTTQLMMSRCLAAYAQAAKNTATLLEPNFHFNRGLAYHFQDMFSQCLTSWLRAVCLDPNWPNPRRRALRLANFLLAVADLDCPRSSGALVDEAFTYPLAACLCLRANTSDPDESEKARKKPALSDRQLTNSLTRLLGPFCSSLATDGARGLTPRITASERRRMRRSQKKCPPTNDKETTAVVGKTGWRVVYFNELKPGTNQGCLCVGRLVRRLPTDSVLAINLLLVDALNQPIAVRLCNVGEDLGPTEKDILVIPHPYVEEREVDERLVHAAHTIDSLLAPCTGDPSGQPLVKEISDLRLDDKEGEGMQAVEREMASPLRIRLIRVPLPNLLVVNGQPVGFKWTATPVLQNVFFTPV